jgi:ketosteroid isomerase-like protein
VSAAHEALIRRFYEAFQRRDAESMAACYHPEARFSDPAFPSLKGAEIGDMWRMLCSRAQQFSLEFSGLRCEGDRGWAHWEPRYLFSKTGRTVHNIIDAEFRFADGLIVEHIDRFDFWRWSRQALGPAGWVLGWSAMLRNKVQAEAGRGLAAFRSKRP